LDLRIRTRFYPNGQKWSPKIGDALRKLVTRLGAISSLLERS
jgi:hypothetical protein